MSIKSSGHIKKVKLELAIAFEMADIRPISFYLRLKVERNRVKKILKLSQPAYIDKILAKYYLDQAKPCNILMKEEIPLPNKGPKASQARREQYQGMTGSLIFSTVETQPDIAFAISIVSHFAKNLPRQHIEAMKTIMQYLKAIYILGITYRRDRKDLIIKSFSNSD